MKLGIRKPNIKKSIKARTTEKVKRMAKKAINPLYGKKGMGYINNPKKAIYNKVYNKTTFNAFNIFKKSNNAFFTIFIALPAFCVLMVVQLLFYCYKYMFLGIKWVIEKIVNLIKKNKEEK